MLVTPALLIVATVGGHQAWEWQAERRLERFVQGLRDSGQPVSMNELIPVTPVADATNGAVELRMASEVVSVDEGWQSLFNVVPVALPLSDAELDVLRPAIKANREAIERVRAAMGKPAVDWNGVLPSPTRPMSPWGGGRGFGFFRQRGISQLLYAATLVAHHDRNDAAAFDRIDELLFIARAIGKRPTVRSQVSSLRLYDVAHTAIDEILPDLNIGDGPGEVPASRVRELYGRLLSGDEAPESMTYCLRAERARQLDQARGVTILAMRDGGGGMDSGTWSEPLPMPYPGSSLERTLTRPMYLARVQQSLERLQLTLESFEAPTYREFLCTFPEGSGELSDEQADDKALRLLTGAVQQIGRTYYGTLARGRATGLGMAIALYRAEHGGQWPPADLAPLVPGYVAAVPPDPLATSGQSLVFVPSATRPRVYSVGDDGIDDGGYPPDPYAASIEDLRMTDYVVDFIRQPRPQPRG